MGYWIGRIGAFVVVGVAHVRAWVAGRVLAVFGRSATGEKRVAWRARALVVALVVVPLAGGLVTGSVLFGGDWTGSPVKSGDVMRLQVWEDGSGRVVSGRVRIAGESRDASGMTFCLYGWPCTDTSLPRVVAVPSVDGHAPCWGFAGTPAAWCSDGYRVGF